MITQEQVLVLKGFIQQARDGDSLAKRIHLFLVDQSEGLTKEVCLTLVDGREGYSGKEIDAAARHTSSMRSQNCCTHLNELVQLTGCGMWFSHHYGDYNQARNQGVLNTDGQLRGFQGLFSNIKPDDPIHREGMPTRYTFWLSKEWYSDTANLITVTREQLEKVPLPETEQ